MRTTHFLFAILGFMITAPCLSERSHEDESQVKHRPVETIGFGKIPAPRTGPGTPSSKDSKLIPANTNGNPGFQFTVEDRNFKNLPPGGCQATLIQSKDGICTAATASHCLYKEITNAERKGFDTEFLKKNGCPKEIQNRGALWGELDIEMANFGKVKAIGVVNQEFYSNTQSEDSAIFSFSCPQGPQGVPVIPLSKEVLKPGQRVSYGKVMGGKEGLYDGTVMRKPNVIAIAGRSVGEARESILQPRKVMIEPGDSGGGLYLSISSGQLQLSGITESFTNGEKLPLGNYATNKSLDFVRCMLGIEISQEKTDKSSGAPKSMSEISGGTR